MIKHLTSTELLARTKALVSAERCATLALIEHLEEVQDRRLYAELGYSSMWEFATIELGMSEGSAQRRIQAMRLLKAVPEAKAAVKSGALSVTNAAKAQGFLTSEKKQGRTHDASHLTEQAKNTSQRAFEQKLFELSPQAIPQEQDRVVSGAGQRELKFVVSSALYDKLQKLKGLRAHAMPQATYAELLEYMTNEVLTKLEKNKGICLKPPAAAPPESKSDFEPAVPVEKASPQPAGQRGYLPVAVRRALWARSGSQCELVVKGRRCTSRYKLEIDHVTPLALNGSNDAANLQILCQSHNLQQARLKLGPQSMR